MPLIKNANAGDVMRTAAVFDLGDVRRQADDTLETAKREAAAIIARATEEARGLVDGAAERGFTEGFEKGIEEGRREGLEAGRAEGESAAREAMVARLQQLEQGWVEALQTWNTQRITQAEEARRDLLRFAMTITRRIVGRMPSYDEELVLGQVAQAIELLAERTRLRIRVHPDDAALLETHLGRILASAGIEDDATIEPDETVGCGQCVICSPEGEIDGRFETQLDRIISGLLPELADTENSE